MSFNQLPKYDRNAAIFAAIEGGATQASQAEKYGISPSRVWQIIRNIRRHARIAARLRHGAG